MTDYKDRIKKQLPAGYAQLNENRNMKLKPWTKFEMLEELLKKTPSQMTEQEKVWLNRLIELDRKAKFGDKSNDTADLMNICQMWSDDFLRGRRPEDLDNTAHTQWTNLQQLLRDVLKQEREAYQAQKELNDNPETIH